MTSISLFAQQKDKEAIVISNDSINSTETIFPISIIEDVPSTPECKELKSKEKLDCFNSKIFEHIKTHFRYPDKAANKKITGKVLITFTINKEGNVENIITSGAHEILMKEAKRIVSLLPKFKPGYLNGEPVKVQYGLPITFRLTK